VLQLAAFNVLEPWAQVVVGAGTVMLALIGLCVRSYVMLRRDKERTRRLRLVLRGAGPRRRAELLRAQASLEASYMTVAPPPSHVNRQA
jgi:hypothetical protein